MTKAGVRPKLKLTIYGGVAERVCRVETAGEKKSEKSVNFVGFIFLFLPHSFLFAFYVTGKGNGKAEN